VVPRLDVAVAFTFAFVVVLTLFVWTSPFLTLVGLFAFDFRLYGCISFAWYIWALVWFTGAFLFASCILRSHARYLALSPVRALRFLPVVVYAAFVIRAVCAFRRGCGVYTYPDGILSRTSMGSSTPPPPPPPFHLPVLGLVWPAHFLPPLPMVWTISLRCLAFGF